MSDRRNPITEGVIWKQLLSFFFPILLGTFFQQLYNTIDMIVVGRFVGTEALASVGGSAAMIVNLIVGFFTGLSSGAGVIISQYYGAGDERRVSDGIHTAYAFSLIGSIVFFAVGISAANGLLTAMNTAPELMADSSVYLRIYFAGLLFVFIYNIGSAILRALGDSRRPLYYLIICCVVNIFLDLLLVVVFQMGVACVAVATVLAQAVSAVLVTRALMNPALPFRLQLRKIRIDRYLLRSQLYIGVPGGVQSVMYSLSNMIIQSSINSYGTRATAAWGTMGKIDALFWMISGAYGIAITTFVGQNYGAGRFDRIEKGTRTCLAMYMGSSVLLTAFLLTFRAFLLGIFTTDAEVIRIGAQLMRLIVPYYVVFSFVEVLSGALRGLSDVVVPTMLTMFGVCLLRIIWIFLVVPFAPSLSFVVYSYPVTWITAAVSFLIYYHYRKKKLWNSHGII